MNHYCKRFSSVLILVAVFAFFVSGTVKSENGTDRNLDIWSSLLEQYTIELPPEQTRQGKNLQKQFSSNRRVYITRRIGEAYEPHIDRPAIPYQEMQPPPLIRTRPAPPPQMVKRIDNNPTKPVDFRPGNGRLQATEISETDLYLLGAIEKLVYRVDYLEKRLKKTDELVLYLMEKQHQFEQASTTQHHQNQAAPKPIHGPPVVVNATQQFLSEKESICHDSNSTRIGDNCYLIVHTPSTDWQSANAMCKSKSRGSQLLEFDSYKEYYDVGLFLKSNKKHKKFNYWLAGLNPGLLWIWSSSAKPVNSFKNELQAEKYDAITVDSKETNMTDIQGSGRCLSYSFNSTSKTYIYYGQNCNLKMGYLCKVFDLTVENEISRLAKSLRGKL
ncbi:hypothetical protein HA402_003177 [Bradysia odoriphaga]|nr:hypothetical protein HA402_003177 [Bradysia odoriphaga]